MQQNNYTCAVNHKKGELHLYIMNFCFAILIMFFKQHLIYNDIPSIKMGWLLMWTLKKANHMTGITLRVQKTLSLIFITPESEYFNFHKVYKWSICLQIAPHKISSAGFAFGIPFTFAPNFSTPIEAPATGDLLHIYTPSVSDSRHPVTHTDTHLTLFIFQWRRWVLVQSLAHFRSMHTQKLSHVEPSEQSREVPEVLEGRKMDVKWHQHWTGGRGRKWSSTMHWCNIM